MNMLIAIGVLLGAGGAVLLGTAQAAAGSGMEWLSRDIGWTMIVLGGATLACGLIWKWWRGK
jgi:hypothetical protein